MMCFKLYMHMYTYKHTRYSSFHFLYIISNAVTNIGKEKICNQIRFITFNLKKKYLRKGSHLVSFVFPFSLIKDIKDQVGYQVKDSVKRKSLT